MEAFGKRGNGRAEVEISTAGLWLECRGRLREPKFLQSLKIFLIIISQIKQLDIFYLNFELLNSHTSISIIYTIA